MKARRWAAVAALLVGLWAAAWWGDRVERRDPLWFMPSAPVTLYFAAPDAAGLVAEVRWLPVHQTDAKGRLQALVEGPRRADLFPTLPSPLGIRSVSVEGDLVTVDFDRELVERHPGGSAGEILTVFSVVNTLTEIPGIRRVAWRIDGRPVETLVGHLDLSRPIERDPSLILPWDAEGKE